MSKAKDKDSNKESYNYNISAHKIAIVIWIIIIFLLCVFILPFLLSSVAKILIETFPKGDPMGETMQDVLPDFLGGMIGIVIGFFIESGLIKKYRRIDDFKAVCDSLEVYFGELKKKIEKDAKKVQEGKIKYFNHYSDYDFQLLRDVTNSIEKDSLFLNLPNYALSDSKEGKNIHRLLHEIKSNADDYDYYKSCYERTLEYMSDDRIIVNKRAIRFEVNKIDIKDFLGIILYGKKEHYYTANGVGAENYIFKKYTFQQINNEVAWYSNIGFNYINKEIKGFVYEQEDKQAKVVDNQQYLDEFFKDIGCQSANIFEKEIRLWENCKNALEKDVNCIYSMFNCYLMEYYNKKMKKSLNEILKNIYKFNE